LNDGFKHWQVVLDTATQRLFHLDNETVMLEILYG
jgi:hypothetical protein